MVVAGQAVRADLAQDARDDATQARLHIVFIGDERFCGHGATVVESVCRVKAAIVRGAGSGCDGCRPRGHQVTTPKATTCRCAKQDCA